MTCPPNVKPGQKIRFQLPIQLSQQQLESIRVSYDKDGWMRCLGKKVVDSDDNNDIVYDDGQLKVDMSRF